MYRRRKPEPRNIIARFDSTCHCCGVPIKAGELVTFYPAGTAGPKGVVAHVGGLEGTGERCTVELRKKLPTDCFADPGELAADRWNELHR